MINKINNQSKRFSFLIIYQFHFSYHENFTNNNLQYKDYPPNALILSQQNAGNIEVLNGRVTKLDGLNDRVTTAESSIESMQTQIDALVQQQADFANELTGPAPDVTGLDEETTADAEADAEDDE